MSVVRYETPEDFGLTYVPAKVKEGVTLISLKKDCQFLPRDLAQAWSYGRGIVADLQKEAAVYKGFSDPDFLKKEYDADRHASELSEVKYQLLAAGKLEMFD